jgi:hypothetical protein
MNKENFSAYLSALTFKPVFLLTTVFLLITGFPSGLKGSRGNDHGFFDH